MKKILKGIMGLFGYTLVKKEFLSYLKAPRNDLSGSFGWLKSYQIKTVLDIGANEGQFAHKVLKALPDVELHCFEPLPEAYEKLRQDLVDKKNVRTHPFALGEANTSADIHLNAYSASSSFLALGTTHKTNFETALEVQTVQVSIRRLDDIAADLDLKENLFIKIDVQGFEDKVIRGGMNTIRKAKIIMLELTFEELYVGQPLFDDIYRLMRELGFSYHGNVEQLESKDGRFLQADGVFIRN